MNPIHSDWRGKRALVTGGANGIGRATALMLARHGVSVAILDIDGPGAAAIANQVEAIGPRALAITGSTAKPKDVNDAFDTIDSAWGGIDFLVNNAGIHRIKPALEVTDEDWEEVMAINLTGPFLCARAAGRRMIAAGGGCIVNLASIYSIVAGPNRILYCTSKAALAMMTQVLAVEWAASGIRVNAIAPGYVKTGILGDVMQSARLATSDIVKRTPLGRLAEPEEIADAILYLLDPRSAFMTGHILRIDGGWTAYGYV